MHLPLLPGAVTALRPTGSSHPTLYLLSVGLLLIVIGLALATNIKGIVDKHIDLSMRWVAPFSPLRRRTSAERLASRRANMIHLERALGVCLTLLGLAAVVNGLASAGGS